MSRRIRSLYESADWPTIPRVGYSLEGNIFTPELMDLGALGRWQAPTVTLEAEGISLEEQVKATDDEMQNAFHRVILKAAALVLAQRGEGYFPISGWYEDAVEWLRTPKEPFRLEGEDGAA